VQVGAELAFYNGSVFDGASFCPVGTVVLAGDGKVTGIAPSGRAGKLGSAEPVDLRGGTLLPGFIDSHAHPVFAGDQMRRCDLRQASTSAGYAELVAAYAAAHPEVEWITGGGWSMDAFPGGVPSKDLLDAVVSDRPVFLTHAGARAIWPTARMKPEARPTAPLRTGSGFAGFRGTSAGSSTRTLFGCSAPATPTCLARCSSWS